MYSMIPSSNLVFFVYPHLCYFQVKHSRATSSILLYANLLQIAPSIFTKYIRFIKLDSSFDGIVRHPGVLHGLSTIHNIYDYTLSLYKIVDKKCSEKITSFGFSNLRRLRRNVRIIWRLRDEHTRRWTREWCDHS